MKRLPPPIGQRGMANRRERASTSCRSRRVYRSRSHAGKTFDVSSRTVNGRRAQNEGGVAHDHAREYCLRPTLERSSSAPP